VTSNVKAALRAAYISAHPGMRVGAPRQGETYSA
jgi:hypothetical protein